MRVAAIAVALAVVAALLWRATARKDQGAPTAAARAANEPLASGTHVDEAKAQAKPSENRRAAVANHADHDRQRPSLAPRLAAAYATIEATPEEIRAIEAIEAESRQALDRVPDDLVGDDRVNAVIEAEQDKLDSLVRLLGDRRANWYLKLRADELEPEVNRLLMPPAEDAGVAEPLDQDKARP